MRRLHAKRVDAHRRAIATHERAALLQDDYGRPERAAQERAGAALERERLAAERLHREWFSSEPTRAEGSTPTPSAPRLAQ